MYRGLSATGYVYVWADGVHLRIRLDEAKAVVLVLIGVRANGTRELIALDNGYRESAELRPPGHARSPRHHRATMLGAHQP